MVLAWENLQEVFVMLVVVVVVLPHWRFFFLYCFSTSSLILSWAIAEFLHPFYIPILAQLIAEGFATLSFNLSGLFHHSFTASATVLSGRFLPTGVFYLAPLPHILVCFVTQMRVGTPHPGSPSVPALTKLSLPADAWSWTTHITDTRPLVYQLRQWAMKYKITKLLDMFQPTYAC